MNEKFYFIMLTLCWVFANFNSLEFVANSQLIIPSLKPCFLAFIHSCMVMPYSNRRRHNSPSIPQTPYQTPTIPCPNFDPIYQVILLENSNELNLSPAKEGSSEKKGGARIEKKRRWNLSWKAPCFEKRKEREGEIYKLLGEILSKERKKGDHNFL
jgi:hypothetical protein